MEFYYYYLFHLKIIRTKTFDISFKKWYKKSIWSNCYQKVYSSLLGHDKPPKTISSNSGNYKRSYRSRTNARSLSRKDFASLSIIIQSNSLTLASKLLQIILKSFKFGSFQPSENFFFQFWFYYTVERIFLRKKIANTERKSKTPIYNRRAHLQLGFSTFLLFFRNKCVDPKHMAVLRYRLDVCFKMKYLYQYAGEECTVVLYMSDRALSILWISKVREFFSQTRASTQKTRLFHGSG